MMPGSGHHCHDPDGLCGGLLCDIPMPQPLVAVSEVLQHPTGALEGTGGTGGAKDGFFIRDPFGNDQNGISVDGK